MSRSKRLVHSLATGYLLVVVNTAHTLASVPLALHYLSKEGFGLWALAMQVSSNLVLIDLGMAGSISRILIDHKDHQEDGVYGAIIKTGAIVLVVQGIILVAGGALLSIWLPELFAVPAGRRRDLQLLLAGQCAIMGFLGVTRMFNHVLQAHQRSDAVNHSQVGGMVLNFGVLWFGFACGWGLYSLLAAYAAGTVLSAIIAFWAVVHLQLFPSAKAWGRANWRTFRELFSYGNEIFLLSLGWQLANASQVMVISRSLGLDAAANWSIATKTFALVQQVVYKILDFSSPALAEMMVREERERLLKRFRQILILSASFAIWAGMATALCNHDFLAVWTRNRVSWSRWNDALMAMVVILYATTRCNIGFTGLTKQIHLMKYVYFSEGILFVVFSLLVAPAWGLTGIIICALVTNLLCSGMYGLWRVRDYFGIGQSREMLAWLRSPLSYLLATGAFLLFVGWLTRDWRASARFSFDFAAAALASGAGFWWLGLDSSLRFEARSFLMKQLSEWRSARSRF